MRSEDIVLRTYKEAATFCINDNFAPQERQRKQKHDPFKFAPICKIFYKLKRPE